MSGPNCRIDKVAADFAVNDLDDLTLQSVIYSFFPWAKGFHVVPKSEQEKNGAVTFDYICHEDESMWTRSFDTAVCGADGQGVVRSLAYRTSHWNDKQFHLFQSMGEKWLEMNRWDTELVRGYGAFRGLAASADRIRKKEADETGNRDASAAEGDLNALKEDIDAYLASVAYWIREDLKGGYKGFVVLGSAFGPVPKFRPVLAGKEYRDVDVIAVLTALGENARAAGDLAAAEFANLLKANYRWNVFANGGAAAGWHEAREALAAI